MDRHIPQPHCMARIPTVDCVPPGFVRPSTVRCDELHGLSSEFGSHGQALVWCSRPGHREDVLAQDAPYQIIRGRAMSPEHEARARHEMSER